MSLGEGEDSRVQAAIEAPLLRFLGASLDRAQDGGYGLEITLGESSLNGVGTLQAGAISTLLEIADYLAVLPHLGEGEEAVTHAFSACYLAGARAGERLRNAGETHPAPGFPCRGAAQRGDATRDGQCDQVDRFSPT